VDAIAKAVAQISALMYAGIKRAARVFIGIDVYARDVLIEGR